MYTSIQFMKSTSTTIVILVENHMFLQTVCMIKWFTTRFACVVFMNCKNVFIQILCRRKWFITRFTFLVLMNCMNVPFQMACLRKWFATRFTFVVWPSWIVWTLDIKLEKMIYRKIHICDHCGLHKLWWYASSTVCMI